MKDTESKFTLVGLIFSSSVLWWKSWVLWSLLCWQHTGLHAKTSKLITDGHWQPTAVLLFSRFLNQVLLYRYIPVATVILKRKWIIIKQSTEIIHILNVHETLWTHGLFSVGKWFGAVDSFNIFTLATFWSDISHHAYDLCFVLFVLVLKQ